MFSRIRDRFGTAGLVVSIMALVLALAGGAFAASGGLNAKQKKQVKAIAKQFAGKPGAPGATGPAGPAGANGANGAAGAAGRAGADGANGKTVLSGTNTPAAVDGTLGDFYIETDVSKIYGPKAASGANGGWGSGTDLRGRDGSPWTVGGTLPRDATETGTYILSSTKSPGFSGLAVPATAISFPVPLASTHTAVTDTTGGHAIYLKAGDVNANCDNGVAPAPSVRNPEADSGYLCVFQTDANATPDIFILPVSDTTFTSQGADPAGAMLVELGSGTAAGTWAVTG